MRYLLTGFLFILPGFPTLALAGDMARSSIDAAIEAGFSDFERQLIEKYLGKQEKTEKADSEAETDSGKEKDKKSKGKKGMPKGLAKRDKLPPGLEKLQKNGSLPPGLAKRDLPEELEKELPPTPEGYERKVVEDAAVVLVHKATGKVIDVVKKAVTGE